MAAPRVLARIPEGQIHGGAIVELFWADRETMEAAWASPEGQAAAADLAEFADLSKTTWSVVDFRQRR